MDATKLLTTGEVAAKLNRSRNWVSDLLLRGKIPFIVVAGRRMVQPEDVETYVANRDKLYKHRRKGRRP